MTESTRLSGAQSVVAGLPLVEELPPGLEAEDVFLKLAGRPHCLFLDSARRDPRLARYSFVTADPFAFLEVAPKGPDALRELENQLAPYQSASVPGLPPFQGGAAGLLSYDLGRQLERIPLPAIDEFHIPALAIGLYDVVVAFDHVERRAWLISQGFPELEELPRRQRAA